MAKKRIKRPRDPVELGKLIGDIATGQVEDEVDDGKAEASFSKGVLTVTLPKTREAQDRSKKINVKGAN